MTETKTPRAISARGIEFARIVAGLCIIVAAVVIAGWVFGLLYWVVLNLPAPPRS